MNRHIGQVSIKSDHSTNPRFRKEIKRINPFHLVSAESYEHIAELEELAHRAFSPDKNEREESLRVLHLPSDCGKLNFDYIMLGTAPQTVILGMTYEHHGIQHHATLDLGKTPYENPHRHTSGKATVYHFFGRSSRQANNESNKRAGN